MEPVIRTRSLTKWYGPARGVIDLDLDVGAGEVVGFIGPNGAGKTTTIRLLLDFIRPTSGSASIFGLDCRLDSVAIRRRVGYVPGDLQLFDRLTPAALFRWLGRLRQADGPGGIGDAPELAERLSLDTTRPIGELSTGNRRKVGLVQAFMHRPELLILDEPTSGLDPLVRREFRALVAEVTARGGTVFLSSHVLAEVEDVCDRVATIVDGRLRRVDDVADLQDRSARRMRVVLDGRPELDALVRITGVDGVEVRHDGTDRTIVELEVVGGIDDLIKGLAPHQVLDLLSEPLSLEDVFLESYEGADGPGGEEVGRAPRAG